MEGPAPQGSHPLGEWCSGVSMGTPRDRVTCTREGAGEVHSGQGLGGGQSAVLVGSAPRKVSWS